MNTRCRIVSFFGDRYQQVGIYFYEHNIDDWRRESVLNLLDLPIRLFCNCNPCERLKRRFTP